MMKKDLAAAIRLLPRALLLGAFVACTGAKAEVPLGDLPLEPNILSSPTLGPVPGGFGSWRELFVEQERLNAAAARLLADVNSAAHLAGIIAAPDERRLQIYWKGDVPQSTRELLAELEQQTPVVIHKATFSQQELWAAAAHLKDEADVLAASPKIDGSGLNVMVRSDRVLAKELPVMQATLQAIVNGTPIELRPALESAPVASRDASWSPVVSGSRIYSTGIDGRDRYCTLGIPVTRAGAAGWLIARHCTNKVGAKIVNTQVTKEKPGSVTVGVVNSHFEDRDATFISASTSVAPRVYVGRPYGHDAAIPFSGGARNFQGNIVFSSGSGTGLNGPLRITEIMPPYEVQVIDCRKEQDGRLLQYGICATETTYKYFYNLIRAEHIHGLSAGGNSDSGGVVFSFGADGRAKARGLISRRNLQLPVDCPSEHRVAEGPFNGCSSEVLFTDWDALQSVAGLDGVITGAW